MAISRSLLTVLPVVSTSMMYRFPYSHVQCIHERAADISSSFQSNFDQQNSFRSFLDKRVPLGPRGKVLPHWYQAFFWGVAPLGVLYLTAFSSSLMLYFGHEDKLSGYEIWCAIFTAGHSLFTTWAWEGIKGTRDTSVPPERNEQALRKWLVVSLIRAAVADIPAWICAVMIVVNAI